MRSNRGRVVSAILVLAFFVPALTGWAADDCCTGSGHALPGLESTASSCLTANEHDGTDAGPEAAPTPCSCSFCEALFARMGVPGFESPAGLDRVSALPGKIFASQAPSEVFRPPLA